MLKVVDSIMGSGKTSYIIQMLKESVRENLFSEKPGSKYVIATPYLEQIQEIISKVQEAKQPIRSSKNKSENLVELLKKETDIIVCTHELLKSFSDYELLKPYTLIIDEAPDVIEAMYDDGLQESDKTIAVEDIQILINAGLVKETEDRFLEWIAKEYRGVVYSDIYRFLRSKSLAIRGNKVFKLIPRELFLSANDIYIFTYLFEGQNMYYYCKYFGLDFEYYYIKKEDEKYFLMQGRCEIEKRNFPISIYEGRLNDIGEKGLSKNWYEKKATVDEIDQLKRNIYNYLRNILKAKVKEIIWTTFKQYSGKIASKNDKLKLDRRTKAGKESKGNFVSCTARATNDYKEATVVVYAVNRFQKPEIKQFFEEKDSIKYNEELFALQEMLQFIWRSAIREGKSIHAYIPALRMRNILYSWLKQN